MQNYSLNIFFFFFFFNDTATTEIYTLSLHDALPISPTVRFFAPPAIASLPHCWTRSEEHTSELQSQFHLVCRLLLEKKKKKILRPLLLRKKYSHLMNRYSIKCP